MEHNKTAAADRDEVLQLVVDEGVFSASVVNDAVDYYYDVVKLHPKYFQHYNSAQVARHILLLLAATKTAQTSRTRTVQFHLEEPNSVIFLTTMDDESCAEAESQVAQHLDKRRGADGLGAYSTVFMLSEGPAFVGCPHRLGIYIVDYSEYDGVGKRSTDELNEEDELSVVASKRFKAVKSDAAKEFYQTLLTRVLSSRFSVIETSEAMDEYSQQQCSIVQFCAYETTGRSYMRELMHIFRKAHTLPQRVYTETFANGLVTYTSYFPSVTQGALAAVVAPLRYVPHFKQTPGRSNLVWSLAMEGSMSHEQAIYLLALVKFCYTFYPKESKEYVDLYEALKNGSPDNIVKLEELFKQAVSERLTGEKIYEIFIKNLSLVKLAYADFEKIATGACAPFKNDSLVAKIDEVAVDSLERRILNSMVTFNENLRISNFFKSTAPPTALSFCFSGDILKMRSRVVYPEVPYRVYMIMCRGFYGFHVRFRDVSRGGIRLIRSRDRASYDRNKATLFDENYNLALTQLNKNKDIPEGGSKGTILLDCDFATPNAQKKGKDSFFKYIDALLDCMLPASVGVHSHLKDAEILFFGPDEGTAEFMDLGATRARERGYPYWKAITTGKSPKYGGVPHDIYGMTTLGIHTYVVELLAKMGVAESSLTKFQTGGPDGDLGSNEILISSDSTVGIADGSGVAYDSHGLDRTELCRLAKARLPICNYNRKLIPVHEEGRVAFVYTLEDVAQITLPDGSIYRNGTDLRDKFHLSDYATADLFVPCGGRPLAVTGKNVSKMFNAAGKPKFKYIVEGANLFFNDEARRVLEAAGVHLFKDASANKGGVTSSSLEVLAALAMNPEDHERSLTVQTTKSGAEEIPEFYKTYVRQIQATIQRNCKLEFKAIWKLNQATGTPKTDLTRIISGKIIALRDYISTVLDIESELAAKILRKALPRILIAKCGFETIFANTPKNYLRAIASSWIASRYIYKYGTDTSEYNFFLFMRSVESSPESDPTTTDEEQVAATSSGGSTRAMGRETSYKQVPVKTRIPSDVGLSPSTGTSPRPAAGNTSSPSPAIATSPRAVKK